MKNKKGEDLSDMQEQILYYHGYGSGHSAEKQAKIIGLAQTLQSFTNFFNNNGESSGSSELEVVSEPSSLVWKTSKGKSTLLRAEGDYWMLMVIIFKEMVQFITNIASLCRELILISIIQNLDMMTIYQTSLCDV